MWILDCFIEVILRITIGKAVWEDLVDHCILHPVWCLIAILIYHQIIWCYIGQSRSITCAIVSVIIAIGDDIGTIRDNEVIGQFSNLSEVGGNSPALYAVCCISVLGKFQILLIIWIPLHDHSYIAYIGTSFKSEGHILIGWNCSPYTLIVTTFCVVFDRLGLYFFIRSIVIIYERCRIEVEVDGLLFIESEFIIKVFLAIVGCLNVLIATCWKCYRCGVDATQEIIS